MGQGGGRREGAGGREESRGARTAPSSRAGVASTVTVCADAARLRGLLAAACSSVAGTSGSLRPSRPPPLCDDPRASAPAQLPAFFRNLVMRDLMGLELVF